MQGEEGGEGEGREGGGEREDKGKSPFAGLLSGQNMRGGILICAAICMCLFRSKSAPSYEGHDDTPIILSTLAIPTHLPWRRTSRRRCEC